MVDLALHARRRSPLAHLAGVLAATGDESRVALRELPYRGQVELRVDPESAAAAAATGTLGVALPGPGRAARSGPRYVLWCGPGWYLVVDEEPDPDLEARLLGALGAEPGVVVDVSALRTILELTGKHARDVLSHGCTLDLHPRVFFAGCCAQTNLSKAQVILQHVAPGPSGVTTYRIFVRASYADYLARWLLDAMVEYVGG